MVTVANVQDHTTGARLLDHAAAHPTRRKIWVDGGYRQMPVEHGPALGIDIVRRDPATRGFTVLPPRWAVERTFGWFMNFPRLTRDYETLPTRSTAMIHLAVIDLLSRRSTGESTPTWRPDTEYEQVNRVKTHTNRYANRSSDWT